MKIDLNIRFEAKEITAKYQSRSVMGIDQVLEFQSTVARFLVKKRAIEQDSNMSPKAKYHLLKCLSSRETSDRSARWSEVTKLLQESSTCHIGITLLLQRLQFTAFALSS